MGCCCKLLFFSSAHFTLFLIGSQPVSPPARACPDLPPASHSGLGAGGLAGRQADRSPTQLCSLQQRVCFVQSSHSRIACHCWCSILQRQGHCFRTHTAFLPEFPKTTRFHVCYIRTEQELRNCTYSVSFLQYASCSSIKGEIPPLRCP